MWRKTHLRHIDVALVTDTPHTCGVGHVNASKTANIWHKNTNLSAFPKKLCKNIEIHQRFTCFFIAFTAKRRTFDKILKLLYKNIGIL